VKVVINYVITESFFYFDIGLNSRRSNYLLNY